MLGAYTTFKGRWGKIYQVVMLSDPIEDEERFREIIEDAIRKGVVEEYAVFRNEAKASKARRMKKAREEEKEAAEAVKQLGADKLLKGSSGDAPANSKKKPKKESGGHMDDLAAMIQARQASRMSGSFLDGLAAKYGGKKSANGPDELDEEEFQRIQKGLGMSKSKDKANGKGKERKEKVHSEDDVEVDEDPAPKKKSSRGRRRQIEVEEEDEDEDEEMDDVADDQAEEAEEDEEEVEVEEPAPKKRAKKQGTRQSKRSKPTRA